MLFKHSTHGVFMTRRFVSPRLKGSFSLLEDGNVVLHIDLAYLLQCDGSIVSSNTSDRVSEEVVMTLAELAQLLGAGRAIQATAEAVPPPLMK